jgi:hypothetical protein
MKTNLLLLTLIICFTGTVKAQSVTNQEKGYFNLTEVGYSFGNHTYDIQISPTKYDGGTSGTYAFNLRNINGLFLTNNISVGIGLGLENYTDNDSYFDNKNLFQLFLDARYYFKNERNTLFIFGDVGTGLKIDDNFNKGQMFNLGFGYKFKLGTKTSMTGSLGYNDQTIKSDPVITKNRYYGLGFKIGLLF